MEQFREWLAAGARRWLARWANDDARKALRISAALTFLCGMLFGGLLTALALQPATLIIVAFGALAGYGVRSFISYRRRQAARRDWL
ncbi:hypothetical protein [Bosea sp. ASV33]|uniref:hypothetical protein n=1 Tax=Bosea sp. ASV33 TaxID=2795106 RepID=UPI0018EA9571|nr:hypothetical protein [Bosea sp. ASV33]